MSMPPASGVDAPRDPKAEGALRHELLDLGDLGSNRFLEIGRRLRAFYEGLPDNGGKIKAMIDLLEGTRISRRSAHYWIDIDRIYSRHNIPDERLARIGWSKLIMMARHINRRNVEDWLSFAERSTTSEVRARLSREEPSRHHVVFKLSAAENAALTAALLESGATASGKRRLLNKEAALLELCRRARAAEVTHAAGASHDVSPVREDLEAAWTMSR